jgi:hypothetical protein
MLTYNKQTGLLATCVAWPTSDSLTLAHELKYDDVCRLALLFRFVTVCSGMCRTCQRSVYIVHV